MRGTEMKTVCQTVSNEIKDKKNQISTQCRACGATDISKYVNIFLRKKRTTLIFSSLVSEF